jgi:cephalosporin hydroxylase
VTGWWGGGWDEDPVILTAMAAGASQDPAELAGALAQIAGLKPEIVVEIGCDRGGTLLAWRSVCHEVYGITTESNDWETGGSGEPLDAHGAIVHIGDSHDGQSLRWLVSHLGRGYQPVDAIRPVDALVLDGDHLVAGIRRDLVMYGPLVRTGGLILLHDIASVGDDRAEVWKVWPDLKARYGATEIINPEGGPGWGVITVRVGDKFELEETRDDQEDHADGDAAGARRPG